MRTPIALFCIASTLIQQAVSATGVPPRVSSQQAVATYPPPKPDSDPLKVPGESPAYYCSDPTNDLFQNISLDFYPTNPRIGSYLSIQFIGYLASGTGNVPWPNITGVVDGRPELGPMYYSPLCDINVVQNMLVPTPEGEMEMGEHRSCPPAIHEGWAIISSPPIPLVPTVAPPGRYELKAEATTQDGRRIFCVEGAFDITW